MIAIGVYTVEDLKKELPKLRSYLKPRTEKFADVYKFAHTWACVPPAKVLPKETAVALWELLLRPLNFQLFPNFIEFIKQSGTSESCLRV